MRGLATVMERRFHMVGAVLALACAAALAGACARSRVVDWVATPGAPTTASVRNAIPVDTVPTIAEALFDYLKEGKYKSFKHESKVHPSRGHQFDVRVYLNPLLDNSLTAGNEEHPKDAAAVKEMYDTQTGEFRGWSVSVKTREKSDAGNAWYWYAITSTGADKRANPDFAEVGIPFCVGCHTPGRDYVLIEHPLK